MIRNKVTALIAAFTIITSSFMMTACHGKVIKDDSELNSSTISFDLPEGYVFDESKSYEITFWAKNDTNKNQRDIYARAIDEFEELYPNITVNIKGYTDYARIYQDVITNIQTNTTPNICITYPDHICTYNTGNCVVPLDSLIANSDYGLGGSKVKFDGPSYEDMIPQFMNEVTIDGQVFAMPFMRSTEACYINKDLVEALGYEVPDILTWDFIWEVSDAATAQNSDGTYKINGQKTMIPFIYKSTDNMMIQSLWQLGAPYSTSNGDILLFNDSTRDVLRSIVPHVLNGAFSTFKISSYPGNFINAGQCIFGIDSTAGSTWIGSHAPLVDIDESELVEFETVVRPIPQYDVNNPLMISQGPSICIFDKANKDEVVASWLFVQYLLTNDIQMSYAQTEGYVPVTSSAQNDPAYLDYLSRGGEDNEMYYQVKIDATKILLDNIDHTFVTPVFNGSTSVRDAAGTLIETVCNAARRKTTVDEAYIDNTFDDISARYNLSEYGSNGTKDLGPMPKDSIILLTTLGGVWVLIVTYYIFDYIKGRKNSNNN